jgi:hypothetical protein
MAVRIKTHWHDDERERSLEEIAGAIAFNGWKIAVDKAVELHSEHFHYSDDRQRLGVVQEYLIFLVQLVDRLAHERLDEADRGRLVIALAKRLAELVQDNAEDLLGPGDHGREFLQRFNQRAQEYAEFGFSADGPSYPFYRHLGAEIQGVMGGAGENRWVIDQVMDVDGPAVFKLTRRTLGNLLE